MCCIMWFWSCQMHYSQTLFVTQNKKREIMHNNFNKVGNKINHYTEYLCQTLKIKLGSMHCGVEKIGKWGLYNKHWIV